MPDELEDQEVGRLTVEGQRGGTVSEIRQYLAAVENAYYNLSAFESLVRRSRRSSKGHRAVLRPIGRGDYSRRLELPRVVIESPGFWEFLGSLNPLEVIRQYLRDRHERQQDRRYRDELEEERRRIENLRLGLETEILRNRVIRERVEILISMGYPKKQIREVLTTYVEDPLHQLDRHQDSGLIGGAS